MGMLSRNHRRSRLIGDRFIKRQAAERLRHEANHNPHTRRPTPCGKFWPEFYMAYKYLSILDWQVVVTNKHDPKRLPLRHFINMKARS